MIPSGASELAHFRSLQEFADHVAVLLTDDELCGDMSGDDAVDTVGRLVTWARTLSERRPPSRGEPDAET